MMMMSLRSAAAMPTCPAARLPAALLLALAAAAGPAHAQVETGSPLAGQALYADTPGESGVSTLTASCVNCHTTVQSRRAKISGDSTSAQPQVRFDQAMTRFTHALTNVNAMRQFQSLSAENVRDLGAYLADTTQVDVDELDFTSPAVNTPSAAQTVTVRARQLGAPGVTVKKIEIAGTGVANFTRTYVCDNKVFAAGESCTFAVTYSPRDATASVPVLTVTLNDGGTTPTFTRKVLLDGRTTASSPAPGTPTSPTTPAPPAAPAEADSGGGATGPAAIALLALATVALGRRRRRG